MSEYKLKIGITQGDTNGVGWEVILRTLSDSAMCELCTPIIYGTRKAAEFYASLLKEHEIEPIQFYLCSSPRDAKRGRVNLIECGPKELNVEPGKASLDSAKAAMEALQRAASDVANNEIDAVVTAPINKESMHAAGFAFTGHTEFFADKVGGTPLMVMCSELLRVALVTIHVPVDRVAASLSREGILSAITALRKTLKQDFGIVEPRIAVLSLNPHAGDGGLLGEEEQTIIHPAMTDAREQGALAFGPMAADGLFASGGYRKYDAILAMYHDQGLAPFKTLSPDGVNFTAGIECVRTSPDHGVAYDIAGKCMADEASMRNAIYMAIDIVRDRRAYTEWNRNPLERFERDKGRDVSVKDLPEQEVDD